MHRLSTLLLLCALAAAPARAAQCSGAPAELAAAAAAWSLPETTAGTPVDASIPYRVMLGSPVTAGFTFRAKPENEGQFAAAFAFRAAAGGEYAVIVGQRMWIDVVDERGRALVPERVERGLRCDGIAKTLVFALTPGSYRLQLSEGASPSTRVLVAPLRK